MQGLAARQVRHCALAAAVFAAAVFAATLLGCGENVTTLDPAGLPLAPGPESAERVVLGTGEAEFEPMEGEPRIRLVRGAQGGFHVWASFLAYGFASQALDLTLTTTLEGAAESLIMRARLTTRELLDPDGVSARSFAGFPGQVRDARCADGRRVTLLLQLSEPGGGSAEDEGSCIAEVPEDFRLSGADCP